MAEKGIVTGLKANNIAVVKMTRLEACAKCRACIAGMEGKDMFIEAENNCKANVDEWVEIEMAPDGFIKAVLVMYGIPFLCFMAGIGIGYLLGGMQSFVRTELIAFLFGLVGILAAFLWIRSKEDKWSSKKYRPVAVKITTAPEEA